MGLHFSEIEPLGRLTRQETQNLAHDLAILAGQHPGLPSDIINEALRKYKTSDSSLSLDKLNQKGWFDTAEAAARRGVEKGRFTLSDQTLAFAHAAAAPRMTFEEACAQVNLVRARLDAAPQEIEGITINRLYLFGSTLRDKNVRDTVGDLDISADFGFDARYTGVPHEECAGIAKKLWNALIAKGDDRLQMGDAKGMAQNASDAPGKPFVTLCIWQNKKPEESSLTAAETARLSSFEQKTLAEQSRAKTVSMLISGKAAPAQISHKPSQQKFG